MKTIAAVLALALGLTPAASAGPVGVRPVAAPRAPVSPVVAAGASVLPMTGLSLAAPLAGPSARLTPSPIAARSLTPAAPADSRLPAVAGVPLAGAPVGAARPAAVSPLATLAAAADAPDAPGAKGPAGEEAARPASSEQAGAQAGSVFDGSAAKDELKDDGAVAVPAADALPRFGLRRILGALTPRRRAPAARPAKGKSTDEEDQLDELGLFYAGTSARALLDSHIWGDVKFIKPSEGSKWWWNKFKKGETIRVKAGSEWLFHTQLTDAQTKPIGKLTKQDLVGIFTANDLARNGIAILRAAVVERLTKAHKGQFDVNLRTEVRLLHFKTPKQLGDESDAGKPKTEIYDPYAERAPLKLPADSPLRRLNEYYPKAVMVDLSLFEGHRIPPQLIEDMGKLQRAGVKFVFFSDKAGADHKAHQAQITDGLYGSLFALDGGALVVSHSRDKAHTRAADLLTEYDRGVLLSHARIAAYKLGLDPKGVAEAFITQPGGYKGPATTYFRGQIPAPADAAAFKSALETELRGAGLRGEVVFEPAGKGPRGFVIQHRRMTDAMGDALRGLQTMGVYANPQEILVISEDPAYAKSLEKATAGLLGEDAPGSKQRDGAVRPAPDAATLAGVPLKGLDLVENALGAVLGEYRQNMRGDFVTSASALDSFAHYTDRYFAQELLKGEENVYAFWGHETHDVMNWVAWVQRNTGRIPTEEEAVARFRRQWDEAMHSPEFAVYLPAGRDFINLREAGVGRLKGIYQVYRRVMDEPGVHFIGTEVPNVFMLRALDRKKGETRRVFIRTIFDFVVTMPSADGKGTTLWIMDFKSGVKPTQEVLEKKIQPRTYRLFTAYKWNELPREYDIASGKTTPIAGTELEFHYNRSSVQIRLNGWHDGRTELEILRLAERMRQDKQRTHIRPKRKARPAAAKPAAAKRAPAAKKPGRRPAAPAARPARKPAAKPAE
ncbi:MAG: PD-(D/E)XK nuclease family protein [Elusimicrobiota bacterium]|nr:PD-(D/E)XK nuclease family protein [Elusimicrobiota bacterium]